MDEPTSEEERVAELRETFELMDQDGDGRLRSDDILKCCERLGSPVTAEAVLLMSFADEEDGGITVDRFIEVLSS